MDGESEQRAPEQRAPEQRAPEQRAPEQRAPDQRAPDQRAPEQRARPKQFAAFIGGYAQTNYRVEWDGNALRYYTGEFHPADRLMATVEPSAHVGCQFVIMRIIKNPPTWQG